MDDVVVGVVGIVVVVASMQRRLESSRATARLDGRGGISTIDTDSRNETDAVRDRKLAAIALGWPTITCMLVRAVHVEADAETDDGALLASKGAAL